LHFYIIGAIILIVIMARQNAKDVDNAQLTDIFGLLWLLVILVPFNVFMIIVLHKYSSLLLNGRVPSNNPHVVVRSLLAVAPRRHTVI
jgi:hypothetical protein